MTRLESKLGKGLDEGGSGISRCQALFPKNQQSILDKIAERECNRTCTITCHGQSRPPWAKADVLSTADIPDELLAQYFVFSFGNQARFLFGRA